MIEWEIIASGIFEGMTKEEVIIQLKNDPIGHVLDDEKYLIIKVEGETVWH